MIKSESREAGRADSLAIFAKGSSDFFKKSPQIWRNLPRKKSARNPADGGTKEKWKKFYVTMKDAINKQRAPRNRTITLNDEDIWFCTLSDDYHFDVDAVKMKRKVIAPYKDENGKPKDWEDNGDGKYRITHLSNIWTDITIPFWSMPENTDHPTQKPEKLVAKIILASSKPNDVVFDPFLGSRTTSVVAHKLGRRYVGIDIDEFYCCLAEKRLENTR